MALVSLLICTALGTIILATFYTGHHFNSSLYHRWHERPEHRFWHWFVVTSVSILSLSLIFQYHSSIEIDDLLPIKAAKAQVAGLVAAYNFNEGSGTSAADSSGNGHTSTLTNGPTWTTGKYGDALSFDGADDYVNVPDAASLDLTNWTISAWIYPTSLPFVTWKTILCKGGDCTNYYLQTYGTELEGGFESPAGNWRRFRTTGATLQLNTWYHVAFTFDDAANTGKVYISGVERFSKTETAVPVTTATPLRIGTDNWDENWSGLLDDLRIYNRALTQAEIQTDMNTPVSGSPPPFDTTFVSPSQTQNQLTIYSGSPDGKLPAGSSGIELRVSTSDSATCKFDDVADMDYNTMRYMFSDTGRTVHTNMLSGLKDGASYSYYVICKNADGETNNTAYPISFLIEDTPVYNFTLSGDGNRDIVQNTTLSYPVRISFGSNISQPVTLSAATPIGVKASFVPEACVGSCAVNLILTTFSSTPIAASEVVVTAVSKNITRTLSFKLSIIQPRLFEKIPILTLSANDKKNNLTLPSPNDGATLKWESQYATTCNAYGDWSGAQLLNGTFSTGPLTVPRTYILSCSNSNGEIRRSITVNPLTMGAGPMVNIAITGNGKDGDVEISSQEPLILKWDAEYASSCLLINKENYASGPWPVSGTKTISTITKNTTFIFTCFNGQGSQEDALTVNPKAAPEEQTKKTPTIPQASTPLPAPIATMQEPQPTVTQGITISRWLTFGSRGDDIRALQRFFNTTIYRLAESGPGAPGEETTYFGPLTERALQRFQCDKLQVCSGNPATTGYGATGPRTRRALWEASMR